MADDSIAVKAARGAGWVFAWRMVTRLLGLVSTLVLVRYLQPGDFGLVAIAVAFSAGIDAMSAIGTEYALIRENSPNRDLYDTAFTMNLIRGVISVALVVLAAWPLARFVDEPRIVPLMLVLSVALLMSAAENIGVVEFRRDFAFNKEFQLFLVPRVLGVVCNIVLAILWPSYWVLVIGTLLTRASRMIFSYVIHPYRPRVTLRAWRPLFGFSVWVWAQSVVGVLRERADPIVLGRLLDPARVGIFSVAAEIALLAATEIMEPISRALFPGFAAAQRDSGGMAGAFCRAMAAIATIVLPVCLGISLVADPVVRLMLGAKWLAGIEVVQVMAAASAASVIGYAAGNILGVAGKTHWQFLLALLSACVRLPLLAFMVWRQELPGAATALAFSALFDASVTAIVVGRYLGLGAVDYVTMFWRPVLATAAMVVVVAGFGLGWMSMAGDATLWQLCLHIVAAGALGAGVYTSVLALAWLAAGRPEGAERFLIHLATGILRRVTKRRGVTPG